MEVAGNTGKWKRGFQEDLACCLIMSGLDRAGYRLGSKDLKVLWDTQEVAKGQRGGSIPILLEECLFGLTFLHTGHPCDVSFE